MAEAAGKFSKLAGLSAWQWWVILSSPLVLLATWARLRSGGYRRALAATQRAGISALPEGEQLARARDTAYALAVAVKFGPWWPKCLLRSLALGWYLGRQGIPFELRLGVPQGKTQVGAIDKPDFSAHAWVEHAGVVLNDKPDVASEFAPFDA